MESELLNLNSGETDLEVINTIFRAAHTIKGSAGTFGFMEISEFTHGMETMLDHMRDGRLSVSQEAVALLLKAVDFLREMIQCSKESKDTDKDTAGSLQEQFARFVNDTAEPESKPVDAVEASTEQPKQEMTWYVSFYPHENLFYTGNDPFRLIRELKTLGELKVKHDANNLPSFSELDVQNCYLGWEIELRGEVTQEQIEDVFAWVEGDCRLEIKSEYELNPAAGRRKQEDRRDVPAQKTGRRKTDKSTSPGQETTSIRVSTDKVDDLMNLVGELVITQSILSRACEDLGTEKLEKLGESLDQLERNTRDLQERTMSIRMLPVDFAFQRLPRIVHDLSITLGKQIDLKFTGETTELDKTVLEKIGDPLMHLVRNALDHGIESPDVRRASGKTEKGTIHVNAYHQGGNIIIEIADDGAGLDTKKIRDKAIEKGLVNQGDELSELQVQNLIFQPGFSTAEKVSDVSGRGVGMDVVRRNIADLSGTVEVYSEQGIGSTFIIRLPLTLAILDGQMVKVGEQTYIIPLLSIIESVQVRQEDVNVVAGASELYLYRDNYIPIIRLHKLFNVETPRLDDDRGLLVVVDTGGQKIGIYVDDVVGQQQVVIKSLEENYQHVQGLSGATVLGDGSVALILDVLDMAHKYSGRADIQHVTTTDALH